MHTPSRRRAAFTLTAAGVACAVGLMAAGCGSSGSSGSGGSSTSDSGVTSATATRSAGAGVDQKLAAELPASTRKSKTITAAIDPSFPVNNYYAGDGTTVIGLSPDLLKAVGQVLGVTIKIDPLSLTSILPGLQSQRFDIAGMVLTDSTEREQDIDLLDFEQAGQEFLVGKGNPQKITSLADTCGQKISVEQGGTPITLLEDQSKKCTAAGKPAVSIQQFPTASQALLAVQDNRADATVSDFTKTGYQVKHSNGALEEAGSPFADTPAGWGLPKGSALTKPLQGAIDQLISNGTYAKLFAKYGLGQAELKKAKVNAAASGAS